jgi:transposase
MKAMSKQQLADCAGVSVTTLMNWCRPYRKELEALGLKPNSKVLPPKIVEYITRLFCIDVNQ